MQNELDALRVRGLELESLIQFVLASMSLQGGAFELRHAFAGSWLIVRIVGGNRSLDCERFQPPNVERPQKCRRVGGVGSFLQRSIWFGLFREQSQERNFFLVHFFWLQKKEQKEIISLYQYKRKEKGIIQKCLCNFFIEPS
ncbi:MAG TPA: hypothetical protein QGH92_03050 [Candidatus Parcubacteria bacterium]|nr:hypothetical protein [Candidatus Parcubacteria bacterium]